MGEETFESCELIVENADEDFGENGGRHEEEGNRPAVRARRRVPFHRLEGCTQLRGFDGSVEVILLVVGEVFGHAV
jgi:hypothetical protein